MSDQSQKVLDELMREWFRALAAWLARWVKENPEIVAGYKVETSNGKDTKR